jgi:hypothetical protein
MDLHLSRIRKFADVINALVLIAFIQETTGNGRQKAEFISIWASQSDPWSSISELSKYYCNVQYQIKKKKNHS